MGVVKRVLGLESKKAKEEKRPSATSLDNLEEEARKAIRNACQITKRSDRQHTSEVCCFANRSFVPLQLHQLYEHVRRQHETVDEISSAIAQPLRNRHEKKQLEELLALELEGLNAE